MNWSAQTWPSILALLSLSSCEMFFGEFVEREELDTTPAGVVSTCDKPRRCRGKELQSCSRIDGVEKHITDKVCESSALCNANLTDCMTCAPATFQCQGDAVQACNVMGSGWETIDTCSAGLSVCDKDTGKCELCLPGDTKCEVTEGVHYRLECQATSEGRVWNSTNCNSYVCSIDTEGDAYCETCTTVGAKTCAEMTNGEVSIAIVECTSELRWVTTPCPEGICSDNQCVVQ